MLPYDRRAIHSELSGPGREPTYVLVTGLTQYSAPWAPYRAALAARGFRVNLLGQGQSDKPSLFIEQDDQVAVLRALVDRITARPAFLSGISFGGIIALRCRIRSRRHCA
jgi:alpha-beta hydrolase superfamily lysophospholipase